jgi:hypothetical protein
MPAKKPPRKRSRRMLAGELTAREFTFRIHQRYGHELPLTERLAELDDEYGVLEYGERTATQVDAEVTAKPAALQPASAFGRTIDTPS